ncbi:unnamed protein product [Closterium sp. NIES-54]
MPGEPATLKEALESSDAEEWKKAKDSELKSIEENGTWELGYQQKEKVDYKELFAPVVKLTMLRTLLAGATIKGWVVKQMDVTTAFLNGVLEEEIFMAQPGGFDDGSGRVLKLKKALYGLNQAPRQWYLKLRGVLEEIGFTPSSADHSLFMFGEGEQRSFMVVYVDDILIFSPSSDLLKEVMLKLQDKFKCKALGDMSFYLGLHIERDVEKRWKRVHQRKYLEALAANFGQSEGHVALPFPSGFKCVKGPEEESVGEEERRRFHSLVGSLMYAAVNTRPDVAFATGRLARVVQCPNEEQVAAGMRVAKYLGQTPTVGLQYSTAAQRRQKGADGVEPGRLFLTAFSDASFASEPEDMTSVGGFIFCVGGGSTTWESKKQVDQALSPVESEYMALFRAVREIVWQRRLLAELGEEQQGPTPLYCDSQGAIALAKNPVLHGLTKHMRVKWHWTRSMVAAGEVELHYVKTTRQPADMMTKRLVEQQHSKCKDPVYKARYCAKGFTQTLAEDYWFTYARTAKPPTLRTLLNVGVRDDMEICSMDVSNAFLQGGLHESIFLRRPPGFHAAFPDNTVWQLRRPVYGLKQEPREWHAKLSATLGSLGFSALHSDASLFLRSSPCCFFILQLQQRLKSKDLGDLTHYLGMAITRNRPARSITLSQSHYIGRILEKFAMAQASPMATPLPFGHQHAPPISPSSSSHPYAELVGSLMYAMMCTHPDLAYPFSVLARFFCTGCHTEVHWKPAKQVLRYLCGTKDHALTLGGSSPPLLSGFSDSSWANSQPDCCSSQGYGFTLGIGLVSWCSTRSSSVSLSSCKAELYFGTMAAQESRWLCFLLVELGAPLPSPTLWCDNASTIHLTQDPVYYARSKHIELRYFFIRELVQCGLLAVRKIDAEANLANIFTKALLRPAHSALLCLISLARPGAP